MATSIIRLHAFSGTNEDDPPCYLLQVDDFHCLLDCGWDSNFSDSYVEQIVKYTKIIDAVFISHSDIHHLGALPYLVGHCGLNCPIYTTYPVSKMGQLALYDAYLSKASSDESFDKFTLDDVDNAFDLIVPMKYQQTKNLHGKGQGVTIVPFLSGHMLGGAIWKITKDDIETVYAVDYNHKKELHLNGAMFDNIQRPHLLITSSYGSFQKSQRRQREETLKKTIHATLRKNGTVLFLSDTVGRALELSYLLEQLWHNQESGLMAYGLVNLNRVAANVNEFAKSNVEWMSEKVMQSFEEMRSKPFDFRYTRLCHCIEDLVDVPDPKVIVVSQAHLNYGFGRDLFQKLCGDERNQIVLTSRVREKCITRDLFQHLHDKSKTGEPFKVTFRERPKQTMADLYLKITPEIALTADSVLRSQSIKNNTLDMIDDISSEDDEEGDVKMEWQAGTVTSSNALSSVVAKDCLGGVHELGTGGNTNYGSGPASALGGIGSNIFGTAITNGNSTGTASSEVSGVHFVTSDIYPGQHANSGGQWFRATKRMHLLFSSQESKNQWDEYGEPINVKDPNFLYTPGSSYAISAMNKELLLRDACLGSGTAPGTGTKSSGVVGSGGTATAAGRNAKLIFNAQSLALMTNNLVNSFVKRDELATRTMTMKELTVNCSVIYQNFEGLSDSSSMSQMINRCKPQEIIIVGGSKDASVAMAHFCKSNMQMKDTLVHIPDNGQVINCTKEGHIYQARMSDALVSSLTFYKVGNYELSWLEAVIKDPHGISNIADEMDELVEANKIPTLEPPEGAIPEHSTIFINEPKLSDLKQILMKEGLNAEFMGGSLVVDNCVAIKRSEAGKLLLEGVMGKTYFDVRRVLYSQFAIL